MRRITISVEDDLADSFDALVQRKGYGNRSEAFRDLLRHHLSATTLKEDDDPAVVAVVSYVYDHHERQLSSRLVHMQHEHHEITVASQHIHLDHDNCLETVVLRGGARSVRACAERLVSQTAVRHGNIHLVPIDAGHEHRE